MNALRRLICLTFGMFVPFWSRFPQFSHGALRDVWFVSVFVHCTAGAVLFASVVYAPRSGMGIFPVLLRLGVGFSLFAAFFCTPTRERAARRATARRTVSGHERVEGEWKMRGGRAGKGHAGTHTIIVKVCLCKKGTRVVCLFCVKKSQRKITLGSTHGS